MCILYFWTEILRFLWLRRKLWFYFILQLPAGFNIWPHPHFTHCSWTCCPPQCWPQPRSRPCPCSGPPPCPLPLLCGPVSSSALRDSWHHREAGFKHQERESLLKTACVPSSPLLSSLLAGLGRSAGRRWRTPPLLASRIGLALLAIGCTGRLIRQNPVQRRERGMEDENKSSRMRGWNGCTHKEGKLREIDNREGGRGGCRGGGRDDQGSWNPRVGP